MSTLHRGIRRADSSDYNRIILSALRLWLPFSPFSVVCCETHGAWSDCQDNQGVRRFILKTGFYWFGFQLTVV